MKNILKDFVHQLDTMNTISGGVATTTVKVDKNRDNLVIRINAPSMSSDSFNIFLRGNQLVVYSILHDQNLMEEESDKKNAARHMIPVFNRVFEIPPMVDREQIDAIYQNGQLAVMMPYTDDPTQMDIKRIDIREY